MTFLYSEILINGTLDTIMYLLDAAEAYFGSPGMGTYEAAVYYRLGYTFLKSIQTLLDEVADVGCETLSTTN